MIKHSPVIAITGCGCVCPLGTDVASAARAYLAGASGVQHLQYSWADQLSCRFAAEVQLDLQLHLGEYLCNRLDRSGQLAVAAAREAWSQANLDQHSVPAERIVVVLGTGIGGQTSLLRQHERFLQQAKRAHPLAVVMAMPNAATAQLAIECGAGGGAHTPVSACASGAEAIALGRLLLAADEADVVLVGGTEAVIHPVTLKGFAEMRALSTYQQDPAGACRPFAADRTGFVLGEGAGVLVLERLEDACARRAPVQGTILGAGITSDAKHLAAPDPEGLRASQAMIKAMSTAGIGPSDVHVVSAHATGTGLGDLAEARAIHKVFGPSTDQLWVTAPKAGLGHLLGSAGAVETILTLQALQRRTIPPSLNSSPEDPAIQLRIPSQSMEVAEGIAPRVAIKNAFGFGGHNVSLVISVA